MADSRILQAILKTN